MVKEIPLQNGMVAFVDDEDFERVSVFLWRVVKNKVNNLQVVTDIDGKTVILSRFIFNASQNEIITFKNKNALDCRKENLLVVSPKHHKSVRKGNRGTTSRYKGVYWSKKSCKWIAKIQVEGKGKHLGCFLDENEAAEVYNEAAIRYFGKHAFQNTIGENNNSELLMLPRTKSRRYERHS